MVCNAILSGDHYHRSPWFSAPVLPSDTHLRRGEPLCSDCYLELWAVVRAQVRGTLRKLSLIRVGQAGRPMDGRLLAPHVEEIFRKVVEEIFRKVVAADSPPADDQS